MRSPAVSPPAMTWSSTITAAAGVWSQSFSQRVAMSKSYQATCSDPSGLAMASCSGRGTGANDVDLVRLASGRNDAEEAGAASADVPSKVRVNDENRFQQRPGANRRALFPV